MKRTARKRSVSEAALVAAAIHAREHSYAPYSRFRVGAALLLKDGRIVPGTNVESSSYPLSVCAERNAIAAAVVGGARPGDVVAVAIATHAHTPTPPCGACRQVLAEFCAPGTQIIAHNLADGRSRRFALSALLPNAFGRDSMPGS
jgi:homotetrameric cytidine deaminase